MHTCKGVWLQLGHRLRQGHTIHTARDCEKDTARRLPKRLRNSSLHSLDELNTVHRYSGLWLAWEEDQGREREREREEILFSQTVLLPLSFC
jgi:hypothetical protein